MRISDWSSDVCSSDLLYVVDHLGHPSHHLVAGDDMRTGLHQIGDAAPVARALQNIVRNQRDHLGMVELHAALKPAARDHRRHSQRSEEHTSELQSLMRISYAVFCLKKKRNTTNKNKSKNKSSK